MERSEAHAGHAGEPHDRHMDEPHDGHAGDPYGRHMVEPNDRRAPESGATSAPVRRRRAFRHGFLPGKLIAGLVLAGTAGAYAGDAAGAWHTPSYVAFPLVLGGLLLAGAASWLSYRGRRRAARAASTENTAAPASTSGSQAMR